MNTDKEFKASLSDFKEGSKAYIFLTICNVNWETGVSEMVCIEKLEEYGLKTTNGGDWSRSDSKLGSIFLLERIKEGKNNTKGKTIGVKLNGYRESAFNNKIKKEIRDYYINEFCRVLSVRGGNIEIDHKDGRKEDINLGENQTYMDFQPLHKNVNTAKREHCKECSEKNIRFNAKRLGFQVGYWKGGSVHKGSCIGCFWFDPIEFNHRVSNNFTNIEDDSEEINIKGFNIL